MASYYGDQLKNGIPPYKIKPLVSSDKDFELKLSNLTNTISQQQQIDKYFLKDTIENIFGEPQETKEKTQKPFWIKSLSTFSQTNFDKPEKLFENSYSSALSSFLINSNEKIPQRPKSIITSKQIDLEFKDINYNKNVCYDFINNFIPNTKNYSDLKSNFPEIANQLSKYPEATIDNLIEEALNTGKLKNSLISYNNLTYQEKEVVKNTLTNLLYSPLLFSQKYIENQNQFIKSIPNFDKLFSYFYHITKDKEKSYLYGISVSTLINTNAIDGTSIIKDLPEFKNQVKEGLKSDYDKLQKIQNFSNTLEPFLKNSLSTPVLISKDEIKNKLYIDPEKTGIGFLIPLTKVALTLGDIFLNFYPQQLKIKGKETEEYIKNTLKQVEQEGGIPTMIGEQAGQIALFLTTNTLLNNSLTTFPTIKDFAAKLPKIYNILTSGISGATIEQLTKDDKTFLQRMADVPKDFLSWALYTSIGYTPKNKYYLYIPEYFLLGYSDSLLDGKSKKEALINGLTTTAIGTFLKIVSPEVSNPREILDKYGIRTKEDYYRVSHQYHPDRPEGNAEIFKQINEAWHKIQGDIEITDLWRNYDKANKVLNQFKIKDYNDILKYQYTQPDLFSRLDIAWKTINEARKEIIYKDLADEVKGLWRLFFNTLTGKTTSLEKALNMPSELETLLLSAGKSSNVLERSIVKIVDTKPEVIPMGGKLAIPKDVSEIRPEVKTVVSGLSKENIKPILNQTIDNILKDPTKNSYVNLNLDDLAKKISDVLIFKTNKEVKTEDVKDILTSLGYKNLSSILQDYQGDLSLPSLSNLTDSLFDFAIKEYENKGSNFMEFWTDLVQAQNKLNGLFSPPDIVNKPIYQKLKEIRKNYGIKDIVSYIKNELNIYNLEPNEVYVKKMKYEPILEHQTGKNKLQEITIDDSLPIKAIEKKNYSQEFVNLDLKPEPNDTSDYLSAYFSCLKGEKGYLNSLEKIPEVEVKIVPDKPEELYKKELDSFISPPQILKDLYDKFDITLKKLSSLVKGEAGRYYKGTDLIEVKGKYMQDVNVRIHELAHWVDDNFNIIKNLNIKDVENELLSLTPIEYIKKNFSLDDLKKEGLAEYFVKRFTTPDYKDKYPAITSYLDDIIFNNPVGKEVLGIIDEMGEMYKAYLNIEDPFIQYVIEDDFEPKRNIDPIKKEVLSGNNNELRQKFNSLKEAIDEVYRFHLDLGSYGEKIDKKLGYSTKYAYWLETFRNIETGIIDTAITGRGLVNPDAIFNLRTDINSKDYWLFPKGITDIIQNIPKNEIRFFDKYVKIKRYLIEIWDKNKKFEDTNLPKSLIKEGKDIRTEEGRKFWENKLKELETKWDKIGFNWKEAYQDLVNYERAIRQFALKTGILSQESFEILDKYEIPTTLLRYGNLYNGDFKNSKNWNPTLTKEFLGSQRPSFDFITQKILETQWIVNLGIRNKIIEMLLRENNPEIAKLVSPVAQKKLSKNEIKNIIEENLGIKKDELSEDVYSGIESLFKELGEKAYTILKPRIYNVSENSVLYHTPEGTFEVELDPKIKDVFVINNQINELFKNNLLLSILNKYTNIKKGLVTMYNPVFAFFRNPIRDTQQAFLGTNKFFIPVIDTIKGIEGIVKKDDAYLLTKLFGLNHESLIGQDIFDFGKQLFEKSSDEIKPIDYVKKLPSKLADMSEVFEMGTRIGVFKKWNYKNGGEELQKAILDARNATYDWSMRGKPESVVNVFNKIIPFLRANLIVKTTDLLKTFAKHPLRTIVRGISLYVPLAILQEYIYQDNPEWDKMPLFRKISFFNVRVPYKGRETFIPLPLPDLAFPVYGSAISLLEYFRTKDKEITKNLLEQSFKSFFKSNISPDDFIISGVKEWVELLTNKDFFSGANIVPKELQDVEKKYQITEYTSEGAMLIGKLFNLSPIQVDYVLKSTLGTDKVFTDFIINSIAEKVGIKNPLKETVNINDLGLLSSILHSAYTNPYSWEKVGRAIEKINAIENKKTTLDYLEKVDKNEAKKYIQENKNQILAYSAVKTTKDILTNYITLYKKVKENDKLNETKKNAILNNLAQQILNTSDKINTILDNYYSLSK